MATDQDEPRFALFVAEEPKPSGSAWTNFGNAVPAISTTNTSIENFRKGAVLLPLPDSLPILCQFVAAAQQYGLQYTVRLFGQPLLSYSSPAEPPPQDV